MHLLVLVFKDFIKITVPQQHVTQYGSGDDFNKINGCTRLLPDSHNKTPALPLTNPEHSYLGEKLLIAPAGSIAVFNAKTWHGGT